MAKVLWRPPADVLDRTRIGAFMRWLATERGETFADYPALWRWSVDHPAEFWRAIWDHFAVIAHEPPTAALADARMPGAEWFPGARLNYAEHVLRMPGVAGGEPIVFGVSQTREPV